MICTQTHKHTAGRESIQSFNLDDTLSHVLVMSISELDTSINYYLVAYFIGHHQSSQMKDVYKNINHYYLSVRKWMFLRDCGSKIHQFIEFPNWIIFKVLRQKHHLTRTLSASFQDDKIQNPNSQHFGVAWLVNITLIWISLVSVDTKQKITFSLSSDQGRLSLSAAVVAGVLASASTGTLLDWEKALQIIDCWLVELDLELNISDSSESLLEMQYIWLTDFKESDTFEKFDIF